MGFAAPPLTRSAPATNPLLALMLTSAIVAVIVDLWPRVWPLLAP
jgi:hypothetical protein